MCMVSLLTYMSVHSMHVWFSQRPKENTRCPGIGITVIVSCCMETGKLNLRPLQDQVLSTSELALLPLHGNFQKSLPRGSWSYHPWVPEIFGSSTHEIAVS